MKTKIALYSLASACVCFLSACAHEAYDKPLSEEHEIFPEKLTADKPGTATQSGTTDPTGGFPSANVEPGKPVRQYSN